MRLNPCCLENVLTTIHEISSLRLIFVFIPEGILLCKQMCKSPCSSRKREKGKMIFTYVLKLSLGTMVFVVIFTNFTFYCVLEETKAVLETVTKVVQTFATKTIGENQDSLCLCIYSGLVVLLHLPEKRPSLDQVDGDILPKDLP